ILQQRTIQYRPGRSLGGGWILRSADSMHHRLTSQKTGLLSLLEYFLSESMPGTGGRTAVVVGTPAQRTFLLIPLSQPPECFRNAGRRRGAALLVRHHRKFLPLAP